MSDEGHLHRERLPSFERIQDGPVQHHVADQYSPHMQSSYHYEIPHVGDQSVNMAQLSYASANHVLPGSYVAYPLHDPHHQADHLDSVAEGQNTSTIGTDLNIWSHYNWNAPLASQLVSPQSY